MSVFLLKAMEKGVIQRYDNHRIAARDLEKLKELLDSTREKLNALKKKCGDFEAEHEKYQGSAAKLHENEGKSLVGIKQVVSSNRLTVMNELNEKRILLELQCALIENIFRAYLRIIEDHKTVSNEKGVASALVGAELETLRVGISDLRELLEKVAKESRFLLWLSLCDLFELSVASIGDDFHKTLNFELLSSQTNNLWVRAQAIYHLGKIAHYGVNKWDSFYDCDYQDGVDYKEAIKHFIEVSMQSDNPQARVAASWDLGCMCINGEGMKPDPAWVKEYLEKVIDYFGKEVKEFEEMDKRDAEMYIISCSELGLAYYDSAVKGIPSDYTKSYEYFKKIENHAINIMKCLEAMKVAQLHLGLMFYYGNYVKQDYNEAKKYFESLNPESLNNETYMNPRLKVDSLFKLALIYYNDKAPMFNMAKARSCFDKVVKVKRPGGFALAESLYHLGCIAFYGKESGTPDHPTAKGYFEQIYLTETESDWVQAEALYYRGRIYYDSLGEGANAEPVRHLFKEAWSTGTSSGWVRAETLYYFGLSYYRERNQPKAKEYFEGCLRQETTSSWAHFEANKLLEKIKN